MASIPLPHHWAGKLYSFFFLSGFCLYGIIAVISYVLCIALHIPDFFLLLRLDAQLSISACVLH
jgi:hypothetical protein